MINIYFIYIFGKYLSDDKTYIKDLNKMMFLNDNPYIKGIPDIFVNLTDKSDNDNFEWKSYTYDNKDSNINYKDFDDIRDNDIMDQNSNTDSNMIKDSDMRDSDSKDSLSDDF